MALVTLANLVHSHGPQRILDGTSLSLEKGEKVGLVGRNGCGKTTLLRLIAGHYAPDGGQVQITRSVRVGYLQQDPALDFEKTLRQEAASAFAGLDELHQRVEEVSHQMAHVTDQAQLDGLLKQYEKLEEQVHSAGGFAVDHKIEAMLHGLGLTDELFGVKVGALSGGQRGRLALAKLLLEGPDVLLLDEPTNHLDIAAREWLGEFLVAYPGAVLVVSHDRWLLDEVVGKIVELVEGKLEEYPGNYQAYREQRVVRQLERQRVYDKQQEYVRHQQGFIDRYRAGQRARQAQGREARLERYKQTLTQRSVEQNVMNLELPAAPRSGDLVVIAEKLAKGYEDKPLFGDFSLTIKRGQRIGIVGPNGCGKSTLARTMIGQVVPDNGSVRLGAAVDVGYYHQTHEHLAPEETPVTYLQRFVSGGLDQLARNLAGAFLFSGQDQDKQVGVLSGGERTRLVLAGLMVSRHNLLILDEPSNHLDIPSAERLEAALEQFDGTLLLITHDRMLLQDTVDELLIFDGHGGVRHFAGTYAEYLQELHKEQSRRAKSEQIKAEVAKAKAEAVKAKAEPAPVAVGKEPKAEPKAKSKAKGKRPLSWMKQADLEAKIMAIDEQVADAERQMGDEAVYRDYPKFVALQNQREKLLTDKGPLEREWLLRAEEE